MFHGVLNKSRLTAARCPPKVETPAIGCEGRAEKSLPNSARQCLDWPELVILSGTWKELLEH